MIYLVLALFVAVLGTGILAYRASPFRYLTHAARADHDLGTAHTIRERALSAGFIRYENGDHVDFDDKFIGKAVGNSCISFGIADRQEYLAEILNDETRNQLRSKDLVVVDAPARASNTGKRIRKIEKIQTDQVLFARDYKGERRRTRPISEVYAKITHLVD
jgi:hypothetical protein